MSKLIWTIKQLLPLTYWTKYKTNDGKSHFSVWNMWFGKVFNHTDIIVGE